MLSNNAFFRRLPIAIDLDDRLAIQNVVTESDIITFCIIEIHNILNPFANSHAYISLNQIDITKLTMFIWSIVERLNSIRITINQQRKKHIKDRYSLEPNAKIIKKLRDDYNHLAENFQNMSKKRKALYPLHGSLIYSTSFPLRQEAIYLTIQLGNQHERSQVTATIDKTKPIPISPSFNLEFAAFDHQVDISSTYMSIKSWINLESQRIESQFLNELEKSEMNLKQKEEILKCIVGSNIITKTIRTP